MALGVGDHLVKLERDTTVRGNPPVDPPTITTETQREFVVISVEGCNFTSPDGFRPLIKVVE